MSKDQIDPDTDYSVEEVAEMLEFSGAHVRRFCNSGHFPGAYRRSPLGKSPWVIPGKAILHFLESRQQTE